MKVAICFSGQVRSLRLCIESINETIIQKLPEETDIFCHFYRDKPEDEEEMTLFLNPTDYMFEDDLLVEKGLLDKCYDRRCISKGPASRERTERVLKQLYSVYMANELKKKNERANNFKYDIVFRMRPDQIYNNDIEDLNKVGPSQLFVPSHDSHGGINDRFSFSKSEVMDDYASMWLELDELIKDDKFHPETLAMNICKRHNIEVVNTNITCNRVRENGSIIKLHW